MMGDGNGWRVALEGKRKARPYVELAHKASRCLSIVRDSFNKNFI